MAVLSGHVVLRNPESGEPVSLAEGSEVPAWATDLVGEHLLGSGKTQPEEKPKRSRARGQ